MEYYLFEEQSGGCDYTIGCGLRLSRLTANSIEEAHEQAAELIGDNFHADHERGIGSAKILVVEKEINLSSFLIQRQLKKQIEEQILQSKYQEQEERAEYERLSRKFAKPPIT